MPSNGSRDTLISYAEHSMQRRLKDSVQSLDAVVEKVKKEE